jgi:hypothetical protein
MNTISAKNLPEQFYRQWVEGRRAACKAILASPISPPEIKAEARKRLDATKNGSFNAIA